MVLVIKYLLQFSCTTRALASKQHRATLSLMRQRLTQGHAQSNPSQRLSDSVLIWAGTCLELVFLKSGSSSLLVYCMKFWSSSGGCFTQLLYFLYDLIPVYNLENWSKIPIWARCPTWKSETRRCFKKEFCRSNYHASECDPLRLFPFVSLR